MTPLRQFKGVPADIIRKAEGKQFVSSTCLVTFQFADVYCFSLGIGILTWFVPLSTGHFSITENLIQSPPEIGELLGIPNAGRLVHRLVHSFPKLQYVSISGT